MELIRSKQGRTWEYGKLDLVADTTYSHTPGGRTCRSTCDQTSAGGTGLREKEVGLETEYRPASWLFLSLSLPTEGGVVKDARQGRGVRRREGHQSGVMV